MFTRESVCKSIDEVRDWPMTPENVHTFAALLYIKERIGTTERNAEASESDLTPEKAEQWVTGMENADGTRGAHWSMEATEKVRKEIGVTAGPLDWWVAMNMMYSDYCAAAAKLGVGTTEFYACMAKAFLEDPDAKPGKLARYHKCIADT